MAEEIIKETFNFGIEDSGQFGNLKAANDFLSGSTVTADEDDIEKLDKPVKKEAPKKAPAEEEDDEDKKEEKKDKIPSIDDFMNLGKEEEEEEDDKKEDKKEVKKEEEDEDDPKNTYAAFSKDLYKMNVLTTDEDEEPVLAETPEQLLDLLNNEKRKGATEWLEGFLSKHGEDRRELFDAIFVNGVDPQKYLPVYNEVTSLEGLDLEDEGNQETVVRSYYSRLGWDKAAIDKKVEKLKSYSDLEDEAKTVHPQIIEQDKRKLTEMTEAEAAKEQRQIALDKEYKEQLNKVLTEKLKTKDFDGLPLDQKTAEKAFDFLHTPKWKLKSGEILTDFDKFILESKNPDNISQRVMIALLKLNNFDLSKVKKRAVSAESSELFQSLAHKNTKEKNTKAKTDGPVW